MIINKKIALVILAVMAASTTLMFGDVKLEELPNKGYRVATDTYTATLDGTGTLTSLMAVSYTHLSCWKDGRSNLCEFIQAIL